MKPFSSLFSKILLCFLANLILVVLMLAGFIVFQARVDLHSIVGHKTSDRFSNAAAHIAQDLSQRSEKQWPEILMRSKEIYDVDFALITSAGLVSVTQGLSVPEEVISRAMAFYSRYLEQTSSQSTTFEERLKYQQEERQKNEVGTRHSKRNIYALAEKRDEDPRLIVRTRNPTWHWIGILITVPEGAEREPLPAILVAGSDSITGKGFFFEPIPWIIAAVAVLSLSVLLWIPLVRHITKPLGRMTQAAEEISKGKFDITLHEQRGDEIGRLSESINHMTTRLRGYVDGQKRFLRDVAHELGSPIARIRFGLGILEQHVDNKNREQLADVAEDVGHMAGLVNELLSFSMAELSSENVELETFELLPVVQNVLRREGMSSEPIKLEIEEGFQVKANISLLSRTISNLLRNAVKYGGKSEPIHIIARKDKSSVAIEIEDSGPGVPESLVDKIFEPFFRPEISRDRESGGVGLGLSIVKTCVDACGGTVSARNLHPKGFSVVIVLPHPA